MFQSKFVSSAPIVRKIPTEMYFQIIQEQLTKNGKAIVRVTGISMKPFLTPIRDIVEIIPPDNSLKRGDIVLVNTHYGHYILHRVTRIGETKFDMRGDNTIRGEKNIPKEYIVGIVSRAWRNGKQIKRESLTFKIYFAYSPIQYTSKEIWNKLIVPHIIKLYHLFKTK